MTSPKTITSRAAAFITFLLIAAFIALMVAQPASAYTWGTCGFDNKSWDSTSVTFKPVAASFPYGSAWRSSIESARQAWNESPSSDFQVSYSYSSATSVASGDGSNGMIITNGYSWGPHTLGVAVTRYGVCFGPFGGKIVESDVLINPAFTWNTSTNPSLDELSDTHYNSTMVVLHELGHAFGFDHENDVMTTMNSYYPGGGPIGKLDQVTPHSDDAAGIRALYGSSGTERDVYASTFRRIGTGRSDEIPAPPTWQRGHSMDFNFTVGNRGNSSEIVRISFYLSTSRNVTTSDEFLGTTMISLNKGVTPTLNVELNLPSGIPDGDYYFGWIIDPDNKVSEVEEANNSVTLVEPTTVQ